MSLNIYKSINYKLYYVIIIITYHKYTINMGFF